MKSLTFPRRRKWRDDKKQVVCEKRLRENKNVKDLFHFLNKTAFQHCLPFIPIIWKRVVKIKGVACKGVFFHRRDDTHILSCAIFLSTKYLNSFEKTVKTLLHEMCHAYVVFHEKNGIFANHNAVWKNRVKKALYSFPFIHQI
jgi:hypothetical protein